ncbi:hypothetical protein [Evansella halocellulosilytica]|uniref:hypothetical protein n=1 Tax=Evansella halocellulosilytica TaxID=2011013 RepID=UPI0011554D6D|nr:hypothetical protein [Evansella halocellulosilytica]
MSWRDRLWEHKWIEPFLPNYLKPLKDPDIICSYTESFIYESVEFITDLASLSELPRLNKTFKREIQGFLFKVKIKQKKIHVELLDTKKSSAKLKKRVYITIYRKQYKQENGMGKCVDSTIYYQKDGRTVVRSVRNHHLFKQVFLALYQLDQSLSGNSTDKSLPPTSLSSDEDQRPYENDSDRQEILTSAKQLTNVPLDKEMKEKIGALQSLIEICLYDIHLFDIEEKHQLKRLVNRDLPNLLETYKHLSEEQKQEKYDDLLNTVNSMITFTEDLKDQINHSRMERMDHLLRLNQIRYEQKKDED